MAQVSRPFIYTMLGSLVVGAYLFLTQPDQTATHRSTHTTRRTTAAADGDTDITQQDLDAHFARYAAGKRDPFIPGVIPANGPGGPGGKGAQGGWALTGINVVNGVKSALLENSGSGDSIFLQPGDHWQGLRVVTVTNDAVTLVNALGQQTSLAFAQPDDQSAPGAGGALPVANGNPLAPSLGSIRPLPPIPLGGTATVGGPVAQPGAVVGAPQQQQSSTSTTVVINGR